MADLKRKGRAPSVLDGMIGASAATALVVANMIGVGVFTTLGFQVHALQSPFSILLLWVVGGVVALCGALCYAELATALPRSGGEYHLLGRAIHPLLGFLSGWVSLLAGFAAPVAAAALAFSAYLAKVYPSTADQPIWWASALVIVLGVLHALDVRTGARFQTVMTAIKLLMLFAFIAAAMSQGAWLTLDLRPSADDAARIFGTPVFAVSLVYVSYAYSGWNAAAYVTGELRSPARTLPRALLYGTALVTLVYLLVNLAFLAVVPREQLLAVDPFAAGDGGLVRQELAVGFLAGRALFGDDAAGIIGALVAIGLVSTVSAMVMAGPRVIATMAEDYRPLRVFRGVSGRAPLRSIVLQSVLSLLLLWTATFAQVIGYIGLTLGLFATLTVAGLIVLRRREPNLPRPYRCPGYPFVPMLFIGVNVWMLVYLALDDLGVLLASVITLTAGALLYWGFARGNGARVGMEAA